MPVWYGVQPAWWAPLERDARRRFGSALRHAYHRGSLTYELSGLDVIGEPAPVSVKVRFYEDPPYTTYGQDPRDFPRVHAKPGAPSKHRCSHDGALCLWHPLDPQERRWTSAKGLLDLIEIIRTHLFLEHYWRLTGGEHGGNRRGPLRDPRGHGASGSRRADEPRLAAPTDHHRQRHEPRNPVPPGPIERGPSHMHRGDAPTPLKGW